MPYRNDKDLSDWINDYYESIIKVSSVGGVKVSYYQALRGYFRHSIILTDIKLNEFGLVDYKLWDWILTEVKSGHNPSESGGLHLRYNKVSHLCKKSAYYTSKAKLLKLKLLIKTPFKDFYILNPRYVIKLYNPSTDDDIDKKETST